MSLIIEVAPEIEQRLHDKAARRGLALDVFVQSIIEREAGDTETEGNGNDNDNQALSSVAAANAQRAAAWRSWCEAHRQMNLPSLSSSAFERASFYGERG